MAFETERGNIVTPTDVVSDAISAALVQRTILFPLVYTEDLPDNTPTKKFRKAGSLTAAEVAESAAWTFGAGSEYTETSASATATKFACVSKLTVEADRFTPVSPDKLYQEQGAAIARDVEGEIKTLFSGFSNAVTATSIATVADILQALYLVQSGTSGVSDGMLAGVFDYKAIMEIRKEIVASGASHYVQPNQTTLLAGIAADSGYVGDVPGVNCYQTNGLPTDTGDDVNLVFDPALAIAGMVGPIQTRQSWKGSEGFFDELASYLFSDFVEWNDAAACAVKSDT